MNEKDKEPKEKTSDQHSRRDFLKTSGVVAGGLAAGTIPGLTAAQAQEANPDYTDPPPQNPYGARPGGGISLPDYYKPWPAIKNRNMYLPGTEILPKNEMRITFLGKLAVATESAAKRAPPCWSSLATVVRSRGDSFLIWATAASAMQSRCKYPRRLSTTSSSAISTPITTPTFPTCTPSAPSRADLRHCGFTDPREEHPSWGPKSMIKHMRAMNRWHEENFQSVPGR